MSMSCLFSLALVAYVTTSAISAASNDLKLGLRPGTAYLKKNSWGMQRKQLTIFRNWDEECETVTDETYINKLLNQSHFYYKADFDQIFVVDKDTFRRVLEECEKIHENLFASDPLAFLEETNQVESNFVIDRKDGPPKKKSKSKSILSWNVLNRVFILPGTKWCGQGDIAEHYNDLGYHREVDKCCRDHDICLSVTGQYLSPGQCKNGLCNNTPFTRSPCGCDRVLSTCLRSTQSRMSNAIGRLFFNIAGITCFKYEHPVKRCAEYVYPPKSNLPPWILTAVKVNEEPMRPRCKKYELDKTKPKIWQFFETFYEETSDLIEEPRTISSRQSRRGPMAMVHDFIADLFLKIVGPVKKR